MEVNGVSLNRVKIFHLILLGSVNSLQQIFRISIVLGEHDGDKIHQKILCSSRLKIHA